VNFPPQVADAERFSVRDYEQASAGLGYSVGYRRQGMVSTVYVYDLRQPSIPNDATSPPVIAQLWQAKNDIVAAQRQGTYAKVEAAAEDFTVEDRNKRVRFICGRFVMERADRPGRFDSFACLGAVNNKFFKFRITKPNDAGSEGEVRNFLQAWIDLLWPPS
jgi:hypothetical protein